MLSVQRCQDFLRGFLAGEARGLVVTAEGVFPVALNCLDFLGSGSSNPSATRTAMRNPEVFTDLPLKAGRRQRLVTGSALVTTS